MTYEWKDLKKKHGSSIDVRSCGLLDSLTGVAGFGPVALRPRQRPCRIAEVTGGKPL